MTNIKVGIVEDELIVSVSLAETLRQLGYIPSEPAASYTEALKMIERDSPDLLLIDIQLAGKKDGIDLAQIVSEEYNTPFIFLTANADSNTVERAKISRPHAYLIKPFNKEDLYSSIEICLYNFAVSQGKGNPSEKDNYIIRESMFIKQGHSFQKVKIEDILYLESDNVYIYLHTQHNKFLVRNSIRNYIDLLGPKHFFRVHRSFAVNIHQIETINSDSLMINGREIPVAKTYRDDLLKILRLG